MWIHIENPPDTGELAERLALVAQEPKRSAKITTISSAKISPVICQLWPFWTLIPMEKVIYYLNVHVFFGLKIHMYPNSFSDSNIVIHTCTHTLTRQISFANALNFRRKDKKLYHTSHIRTHCNDSIKSKCELNLYLFNIPRRNITLN